MPPPVFALALQVEGAQGRRQAVSGHPPHRRRGSLAASSITTRIPARWSISGHGEMHLRVTRGAARRSQPDRRRAPCAGRALSRDHPQIGHPARPPQEAVGRPRPVRRRRARHQAAAARHRVPVHRHHHRRRGAQDSIFPRWRPACATISGRVRLAFRWSMSRSTSRTAPTTRSTLPTWRSRWRPNSP